ncbi:MAG: hypothetical protein QM811_01350 [Pirellulales bacterium]
MSSRSWIFALPLTFITSFTAAQAVIPFDKSGKPKVGPTKSDPRRTVDPYTPPKRFVNPYAPTPRPSTEPPVEETPKTGGTPIRPFSTAPIPFAPHVAPDLDQTKGKATKFGKSADPLLRDPPAVETHSAATAAVRTLPSKSAFRPDDATRSYSAGPSAPVAESPATPQGTAPSEPPRDTPATSASLQPIVVAAIKPHGAGKIVVANDPTNTKTLAFHIASKPYSVAPGREVVVEVPASFVFDAPKFGLRLTAANTYTLLGDGHGVLFPHGGSQPDDRRIVYRPGNRVRVAKAEAWLYDGLTPVKSVAARQEFETLQIEGDWLLIELSGRRHWLNVHDVSPAIE